MSLINDALKRAKEVQQDMAPPPAPNLQLRPVEPGQGMRRSFGLLVPAALAVVAVVLLLLVRQRAQPPGLGQPTEVHARVATPAAPAVTPPPDPVPVEPAPAVQPIPDASPAPPTEAVADPVPGVEEVAVATPAELPAMAAAGSEVPNVPTVVEAPPPRVSLPKLQAIIFSPTRPSVMLNGKTLFLGEKLNGLRVTAIDKESVTLVGASQTNVLVLDE